MLRVLKLSVLGIAFVGLFACSDRPEMADRVLLNGKIVTVDDSRPEAQALAIKGDRIMAVGSTEEIRALVGPNTVSTDLQGRLAIPGFIEGHGHYMGLGEARMILDLTKINNWDEAIAMVANATAEAEPGEWIMGRGWHQEKWDVTPGNAVEGMPVHGDLSAVSANNPVVLGHASGHAVFVNAEALRLAGINNDTQNPAGGEVLRDGEGNATGVLRESAEYLVHKALAAYRATMSAEAIEAEMRQQASLAAQESLAKGVTSFHDAGAPFATVDFLKKLADEEQLPVRLYVMLQTDNDELAEKMADYRMVGYGNNTLTVRSIKRSIDGALGSRGAWLLEPYHDMPGSVGLATEPPEDIVETASLAMQHDFQLATHAIGDRANREVLDIYQRTFESKAEEGDYRWRIEHSQHLNPADIPRFATLNVIASMQGVHATSDGSWVPDRLGEQRSREGAYVWQTLWESGAVVTNGTDVPVEDVNPLHSFFSTVTRQLKDGSQFYPEEVLSREQTLKSYTINNAYAAFEEDLKGSLSVGKLADIVVLSKDIMTVPAAEIPDTHVLMTIVGGKTLFEQAP